VVNANKIGLQAKHLIHYDEVLDYENSQVARVNQLVLYNIKGDTANFSINTNDMEDGNTILNRAILRNQWSNKSEGNIKEDIALIDTLLTSALTPAVEEELRETRVIRSYQQNYINEALKYINGLAFQFTNSAGFYHSMAANILIGQLDFEKAAIELSQAEVKGFSNFKTLHLPILFFGGQRARASEIAENHGIPFPEWMDFEPGGELLSNDTAVFFSHLSSLHTGVKKDFLSGLEEIQNPEFKSFFAYQILLRKGHWLEEEEIKLMITQIEKSSNMIHDFEFLGEMAQLLWPQTFGQNSSVNTSSLLEGNLSASRNAYWTPMIFNAVEQSNDNMEKYNILLDASDFNKDPLLWINLVKYSRIIGMDSYASGILHEMSQWVDSKTLVELQLQNH
jgi:hypothetical protein